MASSSPPAGVSCWICLEEGPDDGGQPLMRGCACRGDSGFAHISCLVEYSSRKSDGIFNRLTESNSVGDHDFDGVWKICPGCRQEYVGDMEGAMSRARFRYVESEQIPEHDLRYISALVDLGHTTNESGDTDGAIGILERALELSKTSEMARRYCYSDTQISALMALFNVFSSKNKVERALDCLREAQRLSKETWFIWRRRSVA